MPGGGNSAFWNYEHEELDEITTQIFSGDYASEEARNELLSRAVELGMNEAVRVFVVSDSDVFAASSSITGMINDVGRGITDRLTPINAHGPGGTLQIGIKYLSQSAWNPVGGYGDHYSTILSGMIEDPPIMVHPHTGQTLPGRVEWRVETNGPDMSVDVPSDAVLWNPQNQSWERVGPGTISTSKVTFDYKFSNWHHGRAMDMNDIMYDIYMLYEWGTDTGDGDMTTDDDFAVSSQWTIDRTVGVRAVDHDTLEVYIDFWHFDEAEIATAGVFWTDTPWEVYYAMERMVMDGKASFSRSSANEVGTQWLSEIDVDHARTLQWNLITAMGDTDIPAPLSGSADTRYVAERYLSAISWIYHTGHAAISTGPFQLVSHDDDVVVFKAFRDDTYPYAQGEWSKFSEYISPRILDVSVEIRDGMYWVDISSEYASEVLTFVSKPGWGVIMSSSGGTFTYGPTTSTIGLETGVHGCPLNLSVFALSDKVIIPAIYQTELPCT